MDGIKVVRQWFNQPLNYPKLLAKGIGIRGAGLHAPAAWTAVYTGTGADSGGNNHCGVNTGATDPSTAYQSKWLGMIVRGADYSGLSFDKKLHIIVHLLAGGASTANSIRYFQLKTADAYGELGDKGIEIKMTNLAIVGKGYGASLVSTSAFAFGATLKDIFTLEIIHIPAVSIEYKINGTSQAILTTAAGIPSGALTVIYAAIGVGNAGDTSTVRFRARIEDIWWEA